MDVIRYVSFIFQALNYFDFFGELPSISYTDVIRSFRKEGLSIQVINEPSLSYVCENVNVVARPEWGAKPSKKIDYMGTPVSVVLIHYTGTAGCQTMDMCVIEMKGIQHLHMDGRGWDDIGYNFVIGQDGRAYEARGWDRVGAHTFGWNNVSISFSVMGDFTQHLPNPDAISAVMNMIECGVKLGKINPDYKLYGHRDVSLRPTESPGEMLYNLIRTWDHYDRNTPVKPKPKPYNGNA